MSKVPKGLPLADPTEEADETPALQSERVRTCDKCGKKAFRLSSNRHGVMAYCSCGYRWAIAAQPLGGSLPLAPPRGLSKQTLIEPDWDKAFVDLEGETHGKVGPKRRQ